MIDLKRIFPECNADTLLIKLIIERGNPAHIKGNTKVATALKRFNNHTIPVVALLDSDKFKKTPDHLLEYQIVDDHSVQKGLILKKHPAALKFIIYLCPEFEPWIWENAKAIGMNPSDYGYNSLTDLYSAAKRNELSTDPTLKKFINDFVRNESEANPARQIRIWITYIFGNTIG